MENQKKFYIFFGYIGTNCSLFTRRKSFLTNPFASLENYNVISHRCNSFGHTARFCKNDVVGLFNNDEARNKAKVLKVWRRKDQEVFLKALVVHTALLARNEKDFWYIDSGCSRHMTTK